MNLRVRLARPGLVPAGGSGGAVEDAALLMTRRRVMCRFQRRVLAHSAVAAAATLEAKQKTRQLEAGLDLIDVIVRCAKGAEPAEG